MANNDDSTNRDKQPDGEELQSNSPAKSKDDHTMVNVNGKGNPNISRNIGMEETDKMLEDTNKDVGDIDYETDDLNFLPIDRGWAWVILAGATFEVFVFGGLMKSYGVFFVEFQKRFGSNASETNVMQTVHNIIVSISGVLLTNIGMKYMSPRMSVCIGATAMAVSYLISAFVTDIRIMSLTIGLISGIANVMLYVPLVTAIGTHFKKHRGLANSIQVSGSSIGALVFGPFYTTLFDYYGYTGTMMIASAILFNSVICGLLIRPVSYYRKEHRWKERKSAKHDPEQNVSVAETEKENDADQNMQKNAFVEFAGSFKQDVNCKAKPIENGFNHKHERKLMRMVSDIGAKTDKHSPNSSSPKNGRPYLIPRTVSYDPTHAKLNAFPSPMLGRLKTIRNRTVSEASHVSVIENVLESISRSKVALYMSGDITCEAMSNGKLNALGDANSSFVSSKHDVTERTCAQNVVHFIKTVFDLSVFCPAFVHFLCMAALMLPGSVMLGVYLIPYAKEVGATSGDISIILIVISSVDLVSRISTGVIADRKWLKPTTIIAISATILGISCHVIRFFHEFWSLIVFAVIQGAFSGTYICLYNVIQVEQLGLDRFKRSVGFVVMCHGVSLALFFQLTGLLRDMTGNYFYTYHLIGTLLLMGSVLSLTLPMVTSFVERRKLSKESDT